MPRKRRETRRERKPTDRKTGVSGKRFRTDPAFKNSRRAMGEFGLGSGSAFLLRRAFLPMLGTLPQKKLQANLTGLITTLVREKKKAGAKRIRLNQLQWERLRNFDFNEEATLSSLLIADFTINRQKKPPAINITLPGAGVTQMVKAMPEITHIRVTAGLAAIDFEKEKISKDLVTSGYITAEENSTEPISLDLRLPQTLSHPLFLMLGFTIFKKDGPQLYELHNTRYRAFRIIHVWPAPPPAYKQKTPAPPKAAAKPVKKKPAPAKKKAAPKTARPKNKPRR